MARCLVISPDAQLAETLCDSLASLPETLVVKSLPRYPQAHEFGRLIDTVKPEVLFLDMHNLASESPTARMIDQMAPAVLRIGFDWTMSQTVLLQSMRAGLRGFVTVPFTGESLQQTFAGLGIFNNSLC